MDLFCSFIGLIILAPLIIFIATTIKITMPGPVFFIQNRVGKDGVLFNIIKFRTMLVDPEMEKLGLEFKVDSANDLERMTSTGKFLRRFKLDEIPQLFNVLKGDMSLVGPRPTFERQVAKYTEHQKRRHLVKPGMTGLAQIKGGTGLPWQERIDYDISYIENYSIRLDFLILIKTILIVFLGEKRYKRNYKDTHSNSNLSVF